MMSVRVAMWIGKVVKTWYDEAEIDGCRYDVGDILFYEVEDANVTVDEALRIGTEVERLINALIKSGERSSVNTLYYEWTDDDGNGYESDIVVELTV